MKKEMTDKQFTSIYEKFGYSNCPLCNHYEQEVVFSGWIKASNQYEMHLACMECDAQWVDYLEYVRSEQI